MPLSKMVARSYGAKHEGNLGTAATNKDGSRHVIKSTENCEDFKKTEITRETYKMHRTYT